MSLPLILDAHVDLAFNMLTFGRDYTRPVQETRQLEQGTQTPIRNGTALLGLPEYKKGNIGILFSTLFAAPIRKKMGDWDTITYKNIQEANQLYRQQLDIYRRLADEKLQTFRLIRNAPELDLHLANRQRAEEAHPLGLVLLMEGADGIRTPDELEEWWELGLRLIGPAWAGTRYCGGTREPGPLTDDGRDLLAAMAEYGFILDISHMDETAALEALDRYEGALLASHSNAKALLPNTQSNRHLSDRAIRGIIEREGIIGVVPFNAFLQDGWRLSDGRGEISLEHVIAHIDHICQIAGNARHVGIGSDFDGGFGLESVPREIDTVADLQKLSPLLIKRGYAKEDIAAIMGGNFINHLKRNLPTT